MLSPRADRSRSSSRVSPSLSSTDEPTHRRAHVVQLVAATSEKRVQASTLHIRWQITERTHLPCGHLVACLSFVDAIIGYDLVDRRVRDLARYTAPRELRLHAPSRQAARELRARELSSKRRVVEKSLLAQTRDSRLRQHCRHTHLNQQSLEHIVPPRMCNQQHHQTII